MILPPRRLRLVAATSMAAFMLTACAQTDVPVSSPSPVPPAIAKAAAAQAPVKTDAAKSADADPTVSALTAELFYELLLGELSARSGDPGAAYGLVLDAARRTRDERLFQRAVEIALQSRSGEAALEAARAWKDTLPESRDARRFELQILIALNRVGETGDLLRAELAATPEAERPLLIGLIARNYARVSDKKLAASVVEGALADEVKRPGTSGAAWAAIGRLRLGAGDTSGALEAARKGQESDPASEGPVLLALDMIDPKQPLAEPIVKRYLASPRALPELRIAYARTLVEGRRYNDASAELSTVTKAQPTLPEPWLLLGSLQAQARKDAAAQTSLKRYIELAKSEPNSEAANRGLTQAYLLLSQLAERRKDYAEAEQWLARIDNTEDLVLAQTRRAGLLARQDKLPQARALIRELPERTAAEKKQKLLAEVQLLREAKQYQAAYDLLDKASAAAPDDTDLIYDRAMLAEKLNRMDEMERLLRRLMELKPDSQNAYNALGYSFADRNVRLEEARTLIRKAVQLAPDDPFIADSLGWVEFRLGNTSEAIRILEAAYKQQPDPEIGAHFGEVLWANGQRERAISILKEAALVDADNETLQETLKRLRVKL
ncbi:MAG: tetratricopeptide repeat protein [Gammaproteobacteria bacterium]|nr:tetratricopeptide repeat protein [Gammaproteobacteria bacterium]MBU1442609.1 tetratricopeptide repeat protein [Gammaproteobacteria bacterium]MBU2286918.1 tetratricopeptide repeat protein [Gammaproteobacteria bacterium]MBU2410059.1 tetratricopeptide repeat protein [Gammaproteobacteria bacterium]